MDSAIREEAQPRRRRWSCRARLPELGEESDRAEWSREEEKLNSCGQVKRAERGDDVAEYQHREEGEEDHRRRRSVSIVPNGGLSRRKRNRMKKKR